MQNFEQNTIFKFTPNDETRRQLQGLAQWAKINAIIALSSIGISLLVIIITGIRFLDAYNTGQLVGRQIIVWIFSLIINIILLNASNNIQKALVNTDQRMFGIGLSLLARYFKVIGITMIVIICLVVLVFIGAVLFGSMH